MKRNQDGNAGRVPGLFVFVDAISGEEETALLRAVEESPQPWTRRRTRSSKDYGPYYRYRVVETDGARYRITDGVKRHTQLPDFLGTQVMPLIRRTCPSILEGFAPNQLHVARYNGVQGDRIHSHNDNKLGRL